MVGTVDNVEISLPVKPVDFVHHVIFDGEPYLFHLEFQFQHKDYLPQRTFITSAELTEWQFFSEEVEQMKSATFIDDWITQGIEKGIQQGKQEKQLHIYRDNIIDILIARFELISQDAVTKIKAKLEELEDQTVLQIFLRQAATTESIAKFEALLPQGSHKER